MSARQQDALDKVETFLAKRDGTDKVLKVVRYTSKLLLATVFADSESEPAARLKVFEGSVSTSRKAYRIGKFLQNVNTLRKQPLRTQIGVLELLSNGGEAVYYFTEQITWLVKAGLIHKRHSERLQQISAWAEVVGYIGSSTLSCLRIRASLEREAALAEDLRLRKKVSAMAAGFLVISRLNFQAQDDGQVDGDNACVIVQLCALLHYLQNGEGSNPENERAIEAELAMLQSRRFLRTLAVIQDLADAMLTLPDVGDGRWAPVSNKAILAFAGLVSAALSIHKLWIK